MIKRFSIRFGVLLLFISASQAKLVKDEGTGLYYDPEVEITLGTIDGEKFVGRVQDFYPGQIIFDDKEEGELVIPLHTLDQQTREYFLSLKPPFEIKTGSFTMKTRFPRNEEITVHYQLPLIDGKLAPSAPNLIYYAPFHNEKGFFTRELHKRLTRKHGLSLFAFHIEAKSEDFDRPETSYYFDQSGWLRFVFDVQKRVLDETGLPYRKLLVMGESAGASMAANLAIHYPQWIEAVAFVGGGRFDDPTEECSSVKWFVCHTMEDRTDSENKELVEKLERLGCPVIYGIFPSRWNQRNKSVHFHHSPNESAQFAMGNFLADIAMARSSAGEPSDPSEWNFAIDEKTTSALAEAFQHPAITTWRKPLPGKRLAEYASQRLYPLETRLVEGPNQQIPVIVSEPTNPEPKALVVYIPEPKDGSPDPLYFLADHGLVGIGVEIDPKRERENIIHVRQWIASVDGWQQLPIYYVGYRQTWPILAMLYEQPSPSDHGLFFLTPEPVKLPAPERDRIPLYVLDLRPNADELKMASDHPLAGTKLESSRWIKIPGKEDMETGKRWQALWETIADMSR